MDGLILDVDLPQRAAPFVPPVCVSLSTAQVLALALVILIGLALQGGFAPAKGPRR